MTYLFLGPDADKDYGNLDDLCYLPESIHSSIEKHRPKNVLPSTPIQFLPI